MSMFTILIQPQKNMDFGNVGVEKPRLLLRNQKCEESQRNQSERYYIINPQIFTYGFYIIPSLGQQVYSSPKYRLGFDIWALVLFLSVMIPTIIWTFVPAPNDILRAESTTPMLDIAASVMQIMAISCICVLINKGAGKVRFTPLVFLSALCVLLYYAGWAIYYCGISSPWVILLMTIPPSAALILYAVDRRNLPAIVLAGCFAELHLLFAVSNFIRQRMNGISADWRKYP